MGASWVWRHIPDVGGFGPGGGLMGPEYRVGTVYDGPGLRRWWGNRLFACRAYRFDGVLLGHLVFTCAGPERDSSEAIWCERQPIAQGRARAR